MAKDQAKLIFERKLGHKPDVPGSGQWSMIHRDHENCWYCENQQYTLLFWTRAFGWQDDSIDPVLEENLLHQLEDVNDFEDNPIQEPSILCEATGWQPEKLRKLEDFFYAVDKSKPDHFEEAKTRGRCRPDLTSVDEMNE